MSFTSRRNEVCTFLSSSATDSLYNLTQPQTVEDYDVNNDDDYYDNDVINHLNIAEGLKNMLISHGFNLESLLIIQPHDLAKILGIDEYVAKLIISAAHDIKNKKS